jgi:elongation factor 1-gamma
MTYTLHVPEASFRGFAILIAAEYNGITVQVSTDVTAAAQSPVGKLPILKVPNRIGSAVIFSSAAAARYMAGLRRDTGLLGETMIEQSAVDSWLDWNSADLELPACIWFYPVAGYIPFDAAA